MKDLSLATRVENGFTVKPYELPKVCCKCLSSEDFILIRISAILLDVGWNSSYSQFSLSTLALFSAILTLYDNVSE